MKYDPSPEIEAMYAHRTTGFHYRVRDPDTSSREAMDQSSERRNREIEQRKYTRAQSQNQEQSKPGPFDSEPSSNKKLKVGSPEAL